MNKGQLIEVVYLAVNGGVPNDSNKVQRVDIEAALPYAIDYVTKLDIDERRRDMRRHLSIFQKRIDLDIDFMCTYELETLNDSDRDEDYVVLPVAMYNVAGNAALDYVGPISRIGDDFIKIRDRSAVVGAPYLEGLATMYYYEKDGATQEQRVYFFNLPSPVKKVLVRIMVDPSDLPDEADLPIPLGFSQMVKDLLVEHFLTQKQMPGNYTGWNTDKDFIGNE